MGGIGEGPAVALGTITLGDFKAASIDVGGEVLRLQVPCARYLAQSDTPVSGDDLAVFDPHIGGIGLQQPCTDMGYPFGEGA